MPSVKHAHSAFHRRRLRTPERAVVEDEGPAAIGVRTSRATEPPTVRFARADRRDEEQAGARRDEREVAEAYHASRRAEHKRAGDEDEEDDGVQERASHADKFRASSRSPLGLVERNETVCHDASLPQTLPACGQSDTSARGDLGRSHLRRSHQPRATSGAPGAPPRLARDGSGALTHLGLPRRPRDARSLRRRLPRCDADRRAPCVGGVLHAIRAERGPGGAGGPRHRRRRRQARDRHDTRRLGPRGPRRCHRRRRRPRAYSAAAPALPPGRRRSARRGHRLPLRRAPGASLRALVADGVGGPRRRGKHAHPLRHQRLRQPRQRRRQRDSNLRSRQRPCLRRDGRGPRQLPRPRAAVGAPRLRPLATRRRPGTARKGRRTRGATARAQGVLARRRRARRAAYRLLRLRGHGRHARARGHGRQSVAGEP